MWCHLLTPIWLTAMFLPSLALILFKEDQFIRLFDLWLMSSNHPCITEMARKSLQHHLIWSQVHTNALMTASQIGQPRPLDKRGRVRVALLFRVGRIWAWSAGWSRFRVRDASFHRQALCLTASFQTRYQCRKTPNSTYDNTTPSSVNLVYRFEPWIVLLWGNRLWG